MIGNKEADMETNSATGITNTIIVKSGHNIDEENSKAEFIFDSIEQAKLVIKN
jgi:D-glycero-D-manno-heptose 1,7-bisphosphate phosphatase